MVVLQTELHEATGRGRLSSIARHMLHFCTGTKYAARHDKGLAMGLQFAYSALSLGLFHGCKHPNRLWRLAAPQSATSMRRPHRGCRSSYELHGCSFILPVLCIQATKLQPREAQPR